MALSGRAVNSPNLDILLALGEDANMQIFRVFGKNPAVADTGTRETVWGYNADANDITTAAQVGVKSSSANDNSVWATDVRIFGLDANGALQSEDLELNGTTLVTSANTYSFIYAQEIVGWGTVKQNNGTIDVKDTGDTQFYSRMEAGANQTHDAIFQIPSGHFGLVLDVWGGTGRGQPSGEADFMIAARKQSAVIDTDPGFTDIFPFTTQAGAGTTYLPFRVPLRLEENWRVRLEGNAGDTSTILYGGMTILVVSQ